MKIFLNTLLTYCFMSSLVIATPDWLSATNEEYMGSNDTFYAVMKTVTDNQGNYYSSREVKSLFEYSKLDNAIINQELVSDIIYNIDAEHVDPSTPPKVTKVIKAKNKKLLLSVLTTDYKKSTIPVPVPAWTNHLKWKDEGLYLYGSLLVLPKNDFADKEIPFEQIKQQPIADSILAVYQDDQCIYFSFKHGDPDNYQNCIIRVSPDASKQINDWSTKLSDYLLLSEHETKEKANATSIKLIEIAKKKEFYAMNLEIWSAQKDAKNIVFYLVHRPFDLPMDEAKIKHLNAVINHETKLIKSNQFLKKWIPFVLPQQGPVEEENETEPESGS